MSRKDDCPYQRIEYLQSCPSTEGIVQIKTGIAPSMNGNDFYVKFECLDFAVQYLMPFGAYRDDSYNLYGIITHTNGSTDVYNGQIGFRGVTVGLNPNEVYECTLLHDGFVKFNDTILYLTNFDNKSINSEIKLFYTNDLYRKNNVRFYYFKWVKDGKLGIDFIPVRVGDEGFMYDRVSGKLFGNAGTGRFILGPDINS